MRNLGPLLAAFQEALAWEYAPALQYTRHAGLFEERGLRDKFLKEVGHELHVHAMEEMHHAQLLSHWIALLGVALTGRAAVPTVEPAPVAMDIYSLDGKLDYRRMLELDLQGELDALRRYRGLRAAVETSMWPGAVRGVVRDLDRIIEVEREHERDLRKWLRKWR